MKAISVREFGDQATTMLTSGEPVLVERHGRPIGVFVPIAETDRGASRKALEHLGDIVSTVIAEPGLDVDQMVRELSPKPWPRWMPKEELLALLQGNQADPRLADDLRELSGDTTDDIGPY